MCNGDAVGWTWVTPSNRPRPPIFHRQQLSLSLPNHLSPFCKPTAQPRPTPCPTSHPHAHKPTHTQSTKQHPPTFAKSIKSTDISVRWWSLLLSKSRPRSSVSSSKSVSMRVRSQIWGGGGEGGGGEGGGGDEGGGDEGGGWGCLGMDWLLAGGRGRDQLPTHYPNTRHTHQTHITHAPTSRSGCTRESSTALNS